jgi:hypothetical protein
MRLVTVATHSEGYFPWLLQSCERHGAKLDVLGWGEEWKGYAWRLTLMMKYLETLDPEEVVCFIDGFDVLLLEPLEKMEERFRKLKENNDFKIAVAFEYPVVVLHRILAYFTFGKCQGKLINAGSYIGFAKEIMDVVRNIYNINPHFNADDQQMLVSYCQSNPENVYIDEDRSLFLMMAYPTKDIYPHMKPFLINDPCIFHGAGNTDMNNLILSLGYNMTDEQKKELVLYNARIQQNKIIYYVKLNLPIIIGILIIIGLVILFILYRETLRRWVQNFFNIQHHYTNKRN